MLEKLAKGSDKAVALKALSQMSDLKPNNALTSLLGEMMKSDDREIALVAAIITCYSGNWSGFESLIAAVDDSDPKLRKKAAAQLGDVQFIRHKDRIQTCLLRRLTKETNPAALERVIGSLGTYPSEEVKKRIAPFLKLLNRTFTLLSV